MSRYGFESEKEKKMRRRDSTAFLEPDSDAKHLKEEIAQKQRGNQISCFIAGLVEGLKANGYSREAAVDLAKAYLSGGRQ